MKEANLTCGSISSIGGTVTLGEVTASVTCPVATLTLTDNITIDTEEQVLTEYVTMNFNEAELGNIILNENIC